MRPREFEDWIIAVDSYNELKFKKICEICVDLRREKIRLDKRNKALFNCYRYMQHRLLAETNELVTAEEKRFESY